MATRTPGRPGHAEPTQFHAPHRARRTAYLIVGVAVVALLVLGLVLYRAGEHP